MPDTTTPEPIQDTAWTRALAKLRSALAGYIGQDEALDALTEAYEAGIHVGLNRAAPEPLGWIAIPYVADGTPRFGWAGDICPTREAAEGQMADWRHYGEVVAPRIAVLYPATTQEPTPPDDYAEEDRERADITAAMWPLQVESMARTNEEPTP
jgi:hypothetical protein